MYDKTGLTGASSQMVRNRTFSCPGETCLGALALSGSRFARESRRHSEKAEHLTMRVAVAASAILPHEDLRQERVGAAQAALVRIGHVVKLHWKYVKCKNQKLWPVKMTSPHLRLEEI